MRFWHTRDMSGHLSAVVFAAVGDPGASRLVLFIVLVLIAIGSGLVALAVWLWRATRVDPPALAVLEVMGERRFRRADAASRHELIDVTRGQAAVETEGEPPLPS